MRPGIFRQFEQPGSEFLPLATDTRYQIVDEWKLSEGKEGWTWDVPIGVQIAFVEWSLHRDAQNEAWCQLKDAGGDDAPLVCRSTGTDEPRLDQQVFGLDENPFAQSKDFEPFRQQCFAAPDGQTLNDSHFYNSYE